MLSSAKRADKNFFAQRFILKWSNSLKSFKLIAFMYQDITREVEGYI